MSEQIKYPKEVFSALTRDKVLSITAHFIPVQQDSGVSPYKIYQPKTSRFVVSIVNKADKTYPAGNIRMDEIAGIIANTKSAHQVDTFARIPVFHQMFSALKQANKGLKEVTRLIHGLQDAFRILYNFVRTGQVPSKNKAVQEETESASLSKTVLIGNGKMKGKTPFQLLAENPQAIVDLNSQYEWLKKNLEKHPNNQLQMDAISEAIDLFNKGKISLGDVGVGDNLTFGTIPLYEPAPRALLRHADEAGLCPVYEVGINWHVGERSPIEIRVKRYKAPVITSETGAINPQCSEAQDIEENTFRLTSNQWFECIHLMEANMQRFEYIMAAKQFREAEEADECNRANANVNS